uniref:Uncharacterized protein n=1 Tax=Meloidogyne enterolobii TaxID=390850 RepID=A0A6V7VCD1_MELEN|nr:unnamed protein product [Meloidogyne enterolobii]
MKIARYLLEQVFKCFFELVCFQRAIFNPKFIELLFDENKTTKIPLQINSNRAFMKFCNKNSECFLTFAMNYLISNHQGSRTYPLTYPNQFTIYSENEKNAIEIFEILTNGANKFSKVCCNYSVLLHDLIVQHIETSKDLSKMVKEIEFRGFIGPTYTNRIINYQLSNKYIPAIYNKQVHCTYINENYVPVFEIIIKRIK